MVAAKVFRRTFEEKLGFELRKVMAANRSLDSCDEWD